MKLFPSFFGIVIKEYVDFSKLNNPGKPLRLLVLDEETDHTYEILGITKERGIFLEKQVKKALIDCKGYIETMRMLEKDIKHINEFYMCVLMVHAADRPSMPSIGGLDDLMKAIMGMPGGPNGPSED